MQSACGRAASLGLTLIAAPPRMLMTSAALAAVQKDDFCVRVGLRAEPGPGRPIPGLAGRGSAGSAGPWVGRGAGGGVLGAGGGGGRRPRAPRPRCAGDFERKARAGPRRTLAGFLTGLWPYVFSGRGHLAALSRGGSLRGRVAGWLGRTGGWQRLAGAGRTSRQSPWVARPSPGRWSPRGAGDRGSPPGGGGRAEHPSPAPGTRP